MNLSNTESIIKNIEQESRSENKNAESTASASVNQKSNKYIFFKSILEKMNVNDNILPDAKELQKAVLGKSLNKLYFSLIQ